MSTLVTTGRHTISTRLLLSAIAAAAVIVALVLSLLAVTSGGSASVVPAAPRGNVIANSGCHAIDAHMNVMPC